MPDGRRIDLSLPLFAFRATHAAAKRSLRVPVGMRRPAVARQALGFSPLAKAGRADAARVEGVPSMPTGAGPEVSLPGRPAAQRAPDAWAGRAEALILPKLGIQNRGR